MGKSATGEKQKFDWITASKTKKYKIITAVVLVIGVLFLGLSLIMRNLQTSAVVPNSLTIMDSTLSGYDAKSNSYKISQDETIVLSTGTVEGRALTTPIRFELDSAAAKFLEVRDNTNEDRITSSHYAGLFYLHILDDAPGPEETDDGFQYPQGTLTITCGSYLLEIKFTYYKITK